MCPVCIATTMTLLAAGSASTGGLTALVARKFRHKTDAKLIGRPPGAGFSHHLKDGENKG
jgi:hypothetical protein